ncbi:MAG: DUF4335 domain-containing protein [Spirulinaceae cyanobacterium RM2_2_10]|nr:DUF4335 domain-containing protein [Spirulinaceae cyanobacterium RM2_2_10]
MNIKRQYSLPNCRLLLEGLAAEVVADSDLTRPIVSMVFHVECSFAGREQRLSGGKALLENLAQAVSAYAQEFLSGVRHPMPVKPDGEAVQLIRSESRDLHHLRCYPKPADGEAIAPIQIDLTTVQLFDLVEAIDQFFADTRTLPELTLQLAPASRRYRQADVPVVQRSAPFLVGAGSLAIAALAIFLVPVPGPIEAPERRLGETASQTENATSEDDDDDESTPESEASESDAPPSGPRSRPQNWRMSLLERSKLLILPSWTLSSATRAASWRIPGKIGLKSVRI